MIWMPILPTDARDKWDAHLLDDPRVTQLWDADRTTGRWFADDPTLGLGDGGAVAWDAFLLFGPEARWDRGPAGLLASGTPIVGHFPELAAAVAPLLEEPTGTRLSTPASERSAGIDERVRSVLDGPREAVRADYARSVGV